jgi:hypothetical protein
MQQLHLLQGIAYPIHDYEKKSIERISVFSIIVTGKEIPPATDY